MRIVATKEGPSVVLTIWKPVDLNTRLKVRAALEGESLRYLVCRLLEAALTHEEQARAVEADLATLRQAGNAAEV